MNAQQTLEQFLNNWKSYNRTKMYYLCQKTWVSNHSKTELKRLFSSKLKSFKILETREDGVITDFDLKIQYKGNTRSITARLLCETAPYKPSLKGEWGVNPISLIKNLY